MTAGESWTTDVDAFSFKEISARPTSRERRIVFVTMVAYFLAVLLLTPYGEIPIPKIAGLVPFFGAVILTTDLSTGFLLFVMFHQARHLSLMILGCAYLYAAAMAALYLASFPGLLGRDYGILLGTPQTSTWGISSFYLGFGLFSLAAVAVECFQPRIVGSGRKAGQLIFIALIFMLALISGIYVLLIRFSHLLPALMIDTGTSFPRSLVIERSISISMLFMTLALGVLIAGRRSRVFLWLCAATAALLAVNILTLTSGGRDTVGWLLGRASWMLSSSILFLFFMAQVASQLRFLGHVKNTLETEVQKRTVDLTQALRQRDLLLREVYHRVKNNMQVIDSMLFLEGRKVSAGPASELIELLRKRVYALGLVHQQLTDSKDMEYFGAAPFIRALVENLGTSHAAQERGVTLEAKIDEIDVNLDFAIPLGLLITELVTNSFKHANALTISVLFHRCGQHLVNLTVRDDGADYDSNGIKLEPEVLSNGQGSRIVDGLVRQLDGQVEITRDKGMRTSISMPLPEEGLLG